MQTIPNTATLKPFAKVHLYEELEKRIRDYIDAKPLVPGDKLPTERELSSLLSVSRASVKQAIIALEVKGLVEVRHGDGTYIRKMDDTHEDLTKLIEKRLKLPEVLEAREALETQLAELAAKRRTEADLSAMHEALDEMAREIKAGGFGEHGDALFHQAVTLAANNDVLDFLMNSIQPAIAETRYESLAEPGRPGKSLSAHRKILKAIEAQDPAKARKSMRDHLRVVADVRLLKWIPDTPGLPTPESD